MMENHFKSSLSAVQKWCSNAIVKAKMEVTVSFTMTNGAYHRSRWSADAIVIRRQDVERVHDYARNHASPRDFLLVRLPMKSGLRTGELCTLQVEDIDFDDRSFQVLDSKQKILYPLPLDMLTLQLIKDLVGDISHGYVFTRTHSWKQVKKDQPLTVQEVWHVIHEIGLEAGVKGFKPRILREYFAAVWAHVEKKSLVTLQRILRHKSLETTQIYVDKLVFWEDVQNEYDGVRNEPLVRSPGFEPGTLSVCNDCSSLPVCKYASLPEYATGCRFKQKQKEELKI